MGRAVLTNFADARLTYDVNLGGWPCLHKAYFLQTVIRCAVRSSTVNGHLLEENGFCIYTLRVEGVILSILSFTWNTTAGMRTAFWMEVGGNWSLDRLSRSVWLVKRVYGSRQPSLFFFFTRFTRNIIVPVVLNGCETWSLTMREGHRLRVFENRVLRRIFGLKRSEVTGEWRRLHNKELFALYSSPNIIRVIKLRRMRWAGHVARMGVGEVRTGL